MSSLIRYQILEIIKAVRAQGDRPTLRRADLHYVDLSNRHLFQTGFIGANLSSARISAKVI